MYRNGHLGNAHSYDNIIPAEKESVDNKLDVLHEEVRGLKDKIYECGQQIGKINTAMTEIVDYKLEVIHEEIEGLKDKIANINKECSQKNKEEKTEMKRRNTYLSPTPVYSNDLTRSASDNYFMLAKKINVNCDLDKSRGSQTTEINCDLFNNIEEEKEEKKDDKCGDDDNFASKVKSFFESSTLHGFHNLIDTAIWVRVLWVLALTGAFVPLSMQVIGLANDYLSYPVSTDVSISQGDTIFPALTVCNNRRFLADKLIKLPYFKGIQKKIPDRYKRLLWKNLFKRHIYDFKPTDFADLGAEVNGTISVDKQGTMIEPVPYHGSCYSVKAPPNTKDLTIAFNLWVSSSINFPEKEAGFTVYMTDDMNAYHHPLHEPVHEINVPVGHKVVTKISYDVIDRLNGSYAQCQEDEDSFYKRTGLGYTQKTCMHECTFRTILSKCRCIVKPLEPEYFPFWVKINITGYRRCNKLHPCVKGIKTTPDKCNCKPKCHTLLYGDMYTMMNKFGTFRNECTDEKLDICRYLQLVYRWKDGVSTNNTAYLTIHLSNTYKTFQQIPFYPLLRFMSDIGGTMGLYLGASILTTFEFVQMAISGVLHVVRNIKQKYCPK